MREDDTTKKFLTGGPGGAMAAPLIWRRDQRISLFSTEIIFLRKMNTTIEINAQKLNKFESLINFEQF